MQKDPSQHITAFIHYGMHSHDGKLTGMMFE